MGNDTVKMSADYKRLLTITIYNSSHDLKDVMYNARKRK